MRITCLQSGLIESPQSEMVSRHHITKYPCGKHIIQQPLKIVRSTFAIRSYFWSWLLGVVSEPSSFTLEQVSNEPCKLEQGCDRPVCVISLYTDSQCSLLRLIFAFVGHCPHRNRDYRIGSNFRKLDLIRTSFTLGELVSLVKVFRLFRFDQIVLVLRVWTQ
jgi:hypothetical protein